MACSLLPAPSSKHANPESFLGHELMTPGGGGKVCAESSNTAGASQLLQLTTKGEGDRN